MGAVGGKALRAAATAGDLQQLQRVLVRCAVDQDKNVQSALDDADERSGVTALHAAAAEGHIKCVDALIKAGADVQARDKRGETALMTASLANRSLALRSLVNAGSVVDAIGGRDETALMLAARKGNADAVEYLLSVGASVDLINSYGRTALWLAAQTGQTVVVGMLAGSGADVNRADSDGASPLIASAKAGSDLVVPILLRFGASPHLKDDAQLTAREYALALKHASWVTVLDDCTLPVSRHSRNNSGVGTPQHHHVSSATAALSSSTHTAATAATTLLSQSGDVTPAGMATPVDDSSSVISSGEVRRALAAVPSTADTMAVLQEQVLDKHRKLRELERENARLAHDMRGATTVKMRSVLERLRAVRAERTIATGPESLLSPMIATFLAQVSSFCTMDRSMADPGEWKSMQAYVASESTLAVLLAEIRAYHGTTNCSAFQALVESKELARRQYAEAMKFFLDDLHAARLDERRKTVESALSELAACLAVLDQQGRVSEQQAELHRSVMAEDMAVAKAKAAAEAAGEYGSALADVDQLQSSLMDCVTPAERSTSPKATFSDIVEDHFLEDPSNSGAVASQHHQQQSGVPVSPSRVSITSSSWAHVVASPPKPSLRQQSFSAATHRRPNSHSTPSSRRSSSPLTRPGSLPTLSAATTVASAGGSAGEREREHNIAHNRMSLFDRRVPTKVLDECFHWVLQREKQLWLLRESTTRASVQLEKALTQLAALFSASPAEGEAVDLDALVEDLHNCLDAETLFSFSEDLQFTFPRDPLVSVARALVDTIGRRELIEIDRLIHHRVFIEGRLAAMRRSSKIPSDFKSAQKWLGDTKTLMEKMAERHGDLDQLLQMHQVSRRGTSGGGDGDGDGGGGLVDFEESVPSHAGEALFNEDLNGDNVHAARAAMWACEAVFVERLNVLCQLAGEHFPELVLMCADAKDLRDVLQSALRRNGVSIVYPWRSRKHFALLEDGADDWADSSLSVLTSMQRPTTYTARHGNSTCLLKEYTLVDGNVDELESRASLWYQLSRQATSALVCPISLFHDSGTAKFFVQLPASEFCGHLRHWCAQFPHATIEEVRLVVYDVLRGLAALHVHGVAYGEMRAEQVLVTEQGRAKLADIDLRTWSAECSTDALANDMFACGRMLQELFLPPELYSASKILLSRRESATSALSSTVASSVETSPRKAKRHSDVRSGAITSSAPSTDILLSTSPSSSAVTTSSATAATTSATSSSLNSNSTVTTSVAQGNSVNANSNSTAAGSLASVLQSHPGSGTSTPRTRNATSTTYTDEAAEEFRLGERAALAAAARLQALVHRSNSDSLSLLARDAGFVDLLTCLTVSDHSRRLTAREALVHPFCMQSVAMAMQRGIEEQLAFWLGRERELVAALATCETDTEQMLSCMSSTRAQERVLKEQRRHAVGRHRVFELELLLRGNARERRRLETQSDELRARGRELVGDMTECQRKLVETRQALSEERIRVQGGGLYPIYWTSRDMSVFPPPKELTVSDHLVPLVSELVSSTFVGRYATRTSGLAVDWVVRVENSWLYARYVQRAIALRAQEMASARVRVESHRSWMDTELCVDRSINETYLLLPCANVKRATAIKSLGVGRAVGALGATWLVENSSCADEHTMPADQSVCYMFLARVALGHAAAFTAQPRADEVHAHDDHSWSVNGTLMNTMIVEKKANDSRASGRYRHYGVFSPAQVYPEFLIKCRRTLV